MPLHCNARYCLPGRSMRRTCALPFHWREVNSFAVNLQVQQSHATLREKKSPHLPAMAARVVFFLRFPCIFPSNKLQMRHERVKSQARNA